MYVELPCIRIPYVNIPNSIINNLKPTIIEKQISTRSTKPHTQRDAGQK